jgi:radical SAM superfamily enzyme YgiQ (UPF0313 family)
MIVVNPNHKNPSPQSAIEPPIWCAYLASLYYGSEILDAEMEGLTLQRTARRIGNSKSLIVAMGANPSASSTPKADVSLELAGLLPNSGVVGLHFGNMPDIRGLKARWDLVDFSKYRAHNWQCLDGSARSPYGVVYSSFGCPYNCSYCNIRALYEGITYRDPEDVASEIEYLVSRGVRNLKFCDELFVLNKKHVLDICKLIKDYKLNIWAYARVDTVTPVLLEKMKEAGFNWLCYGFEGALLEGDKYEKNSPYDAVKMTKEAGISVLGNFMFGLPGDDMESMQNTFEMAQELQCEWVNFYCTMAYPGSRLYEDTPKENLPDKWSDYDQFSPTIKPLPTKYLTSEEIVKFRDEAFNKYFNDMSYQYMIKNKFGVQALSIIGDMLVWKPRKEMPSLESSLS